jgi:alpha-galactosidase
VNRLADRYRIATMPAMTLLGAPSRVTAVTDAGPASLQPSADGFADAASGVQVSVREHGDGLRIELASPRAGVKAVRVQWDQPADEGARYLGDHWERGYGDLQWRPLEPDRVLPWYFLSASKAGVRGYGVKTQAAGIASWRVEPGAIELHLDVRSGGVGVQLGTRRLSVADVVTVSETGRDAFDVCSQLCGRLCDRPLMPQQPVYGGNNWYYAYGKSSHREMVSDAELMASLAPSGDNRPFMVIDDGWQVEHGDFNGGPWDRGNARFPDMAKLAEEMRAAGTRPGLWFRPLFTRADVPDACKFDAGRFNGMFKDPVLDPSIPEVLEHVAADIRRFVGWGYELIKHDFSTYDVCGEWGINMKTRMTNDGWHFADRTRTTAEIILALYRAIRTAADDGAGAMILGCNTIGHLAAGLVELQRTGDDTSGHEWARTKKMGVNTLAFRMPQHGRFFAVDADCVGLTDQIPWRLNARWLDLLARSGTPLFVSADPKAVGPEQRKALEKAFAIASQPQPVARPVDWQESLTPTQWKVGDLYYTYDWE